MTKAIETLTGRSLFFRLLGFLKPYRTIFVAGIVLGVFAAFFEAFSLLLLVPMLRSLFSMGPLVPDGGRNAAERLIDNVAGHWLTGVEGLDGLRVVCLLALCALLLKNVFLYSGKVLSIRVQEFFVRDVRDTVHARLQRLPMAFFESQKLGQLLTRVLSDTNESKPIVTDALAQAIRQCATAVAYAAVLCAISWQLAIIALILVPLLLLTMQPLFRRLRNRFRRVYHDQGELLATLQESLNGIRLVKLWSAEDYEEKRFRIRSDRYGRRRIHAAATQQLASPLSEVLASVVAVGLIWVGAALVIEAGTLGPEQFLAFVTVALRAISPIKALAQYPAALQQGLTAAERFFSILDQAPEPSGGVLTAMGIEDEICFEGVNFSYEPERKILRNLNLTITKGHVIALVGPSGSGKSTLVDLLPRFSDPQEGHVTIDGTDIREFTTVSLRHLIGIVSQETTILHDTVEANIAYGDPDPSRSAVEAASRAAFAHDFVMDLPDGYDTILGDRGVRLSGGQRQRIGIARAVLRDPPILILDEATSALDAESELSIKAGLAELFRGRTVIVIAHRLSTVREVDKIFVLDEGRIVDRGTHETLMSRPGVYRRLFGHQAEPRRSVPT